MKLKKLKDKHHTYKCAEWKLFSALYEGEIKEYLRDFLPSWQSENSHMYAQRLRNAEFAYQNHIGNIIDQIENTVFSIPLDIRESNSKAVPDFYAMFKEDCDAKGTDFLDFFRGRFKEALIKTRSHWMVLPGINGEIFLKAYSPEEIYNWQLDSSGELAWVVFHSKKMIQPDPASDLQLLDVYTVWYKDKIQVYYANSSTNCEAEIPLAEEIPNVWGTIPLLSLTFEDGLAAMVRGYKTQIQHFVECHNFAFSSRKTNFPIPVAKTGEPIRNVNDSGVGTMLNLRREDDFYYVSPDTSGFEVRLKQIESLKNELYRITGMMYLTTDNTTSTGAIARSGLSKSLDLAVGDKNLEKYVAKLIEAMQRTYQLTTALRNESYEWNISTANEGAFHQGTSIADISAALEIQIPSKIFEAEIKAITAAKMLPNLPQSKLAQIRREIFSNLVENNDNSDASAASDVIA
jgi:hypothetical protein